MASKTTKSVKAEKKPASKCVKKSCTAKKDSPRTIGVAVIGCGGRGTGVTRRLLQDSNGAVKVLACYDPDESQCKASMSEAQWNSPDTVICKSYQEAIAYPGVEWVMVFSPNAYHKEHILEGFKQGKHVFTEKPLATKIADCEEIFEAHKKTNVLFATGFVLRYAPIYRKVKELLDSGDFGELVSIDANENIDPNHGTYIMRNWRRYTKEAGPHILEKCCHDLDLINWFVGSHVSKVASFGGRNIFLKKNKGFEKEYPNRFLNTWYDAHHIESAFDDDTDLMDNTVAIFEYRNGVRVQFEATMSNAIPERRMSFTCTRGNIVVELYSSMLKYQILNQNMVSISFGGDGHGGGDSYIMKELYEGPMTKGELPKCSGSEGLESAVLALSIDKAAKTGKVVDVEPTWKKLKR